MSEFVIRGGRVLDETGERFADVAVRDGEIVAVGPDLSGGRVLDASGCVVAPGLVDLHTHLREPGKEEAETVESGSRAAALGGYTAVLAMPNTTPAMVAWMPLSCTKYQPARTSGTSTMRRMVPGRALKTAQRSASATASIAASTAQCR